jgi:DNA-binding NarL/FixJ family response regulator
MRGFESAGSRPWAQRTAAELRAAGAGPDPAAAAGPGGRLTAQEMQIAHLAAAGMTNRQIADHVFISSRTVSSHLYRIFPKLGITSRVQLRDVLTSAPSAAEVQATSQR